MAQLMPLPRTVSCFTKTQIGFTFLVPAHLGSPGKRAVKRVCVCVCYGYKSTTHRLQYVQNSHKDSGHTPQIPHVMVTLTYENHALCSIGQILCVHWWCSSVILLLTWSLLAYSLAVIVCFVATMYTAVMVRLFCIALALAHNAHNCVNCMKNCQRYIW